MDTLLKLGVDYKGIFGAAIGDYSGSTLEFNHGSKPRNKADAVFDRPGSTFTDDTVLTAAVAFYLENRDTISIEASLRHFGLSYPDAGYGNSFREWLSSPMMGAYGSYGNGSAMRVSPVAYFAKDENEAISISDRVTSCTHSHPSGMKGAKVVTVMIYRSLHGASKKELHDYAASNYDFESLDYKTMCDFMGFGEATCEITVLQALWVFFHSDSFEDALRLGLTIGWDADTLCAIASSIAEAYYKEIPEFILNKVKSVLPLDICSALSVVPASKCLNIKQ